MADGSIPASRFLLILSGLCALLLPQASAFVSHRTPSGLPQRWNTSAPFDPAVPTNSFNPVTGAIRYHLGADGWSTTNKTAELNAIRSAFAQWQSVPGTGLRFEDAGLAPAGSDVNTADGTNVVYWARTSLLVNGGRDHIGGSLGVTYTRLEGERLAEADLVLNGVQQRWFTDPARPDAEAQFAEGIALHEIGHFLGFAHSPVGGATLFARGDTGVNPQAGLSPDEITALRALYPHPTQPHPVGVVVGQVTRDGLPVSGAAVLAERDTEGVVAGTVTDAQGRYELPGLPPGMLTVRAAPLDPDGADYLVRGRDISPAYGGADTAFSPSGLVSVFVPSGDQVTVNFAVAAGRPDFWIGYLRVPTSQPLSFAGVDGPVTLKPGQTGQYVGVYSRNLPVSDVTLMLTGDGLTVGPLQVHPDPVPGSGFRALSVQVDVASNATPGLRNLVVRRLSDGVTATATGFLVIDPAVADWNFDGLDDSFQRRWFPLFTVPEAAPDADPDGDGMLNFQERTAGTDPTQALSALRFEEVTTTANGLELAWLSVRLKRYQVWRSLESPAKSWEPVGSPIRATNTLTRTTDSRAAPSGFYRVEVLP